jgi:large subunit ribosomal protein L29
MSEQELTKKIADLKEELFNLRFQHATNQLENPLRISQTKKDIALAKTILREKELKVEA